MISSTDLETCTCLHTFAHQPLFVTVSDDIRVKQTCSSFNLASLLSVLFAWCAHHSLIKRQSWLIDIKFLLPSMGHLRTGASACLVKVPAPVPKCSIEKLVDIHKSAVHNATSKLPVEDILFYLLLSLVSFGIGSRIVWFLLYDNAVKK